ncbi:MAG: DNA polymerase III subunit alpha [Magnetococcus sp. WYHC-3]
MDHASFVHLHVHSSLSLLNSTVRLKELVERARSERMPALALTDQGNLFAAIQFNALCTKAGIQPLFGAQVLVVDNLRDKSQRPDREVRDQLILICQNDIGWRSLLALVSIGHLEGSHEQPRIDWQVLERYNAGLICLSGGGKGAVGRLLAAGDEAGAATVARRLAEIFAPDAGAPRFFIELWRHGVAGEALVVNASVRLAQRLDLPVVASADVHFLAPEDRRAHDALVCIGQGRTLFDESRPRLTERHAFLGAEAMRTLFADLPEACDNTLYIARRCSLRLKLGKPMLPDFQAPGGVDLAQWMGQLAREGLERRLNDQVYPLLPAHASRESTAETYRKRLEFELQVIAQMGFPGYFLIVSDFIRHAKSRGIPVGPGRGSGAGSVVAWSLDITDLDPLRYALLFERFLNPERVSMPDFDVDFCMERREEVIEYVKDRYGADRVAQIITFGTMLAKAVIRDVGRVLEMPYGRVDRIAKLVPNELGITLEQALAQEERLRQMRDEDPEVAELITLALQLEGLPRSAGTHAAGVVISNGPLIETVPLYLDPRSPMPVTQFNMGDVEKAGLVKFDFLGLKTLTVIDVALGIINAENAAKGATLVDINRIPLDDAASFTLLKEGRSRGVFQLESSGMREILKKLAPDTFEDIIALVALYRPGPLGSGMVDDFIARKHGRAAIEYPLPQLEGILKPTYGVILYQEQVMQISQVLAGYSLGGADLLRRAMGKKKPEEMAKQRATFMEGAARQQVNPERAGHIFDLMEKFAGYGFNKSHSAAYALVAYQTAWLKAHHPVAFMAATLTCDLLHTDKVMNFIRECRAMRIPILPPCINRSGVAFTVEGTGIRYGLAAVKNVGVGTVESLVQARKRGGAFTSLFDLCRRVESAALNRRVLENLIKCGACDDLSQHRAALLEQLPAALSRGSRSQQDSVLGVRSLFSDPGGAEEPLAEVLPDVPPWSDAEQLAQEKSALGFYITGHPLDKYAAELADYGLENVARLRERAMPGGGGGRSGRDGDGVRVAGLVAEIKLHRTRKGDRMAFVTLEDGHGQFEVVLFSEIYAASRTLLDSAQPLVVTGPVEVEDDVVKMTAERVESLESLRERLCRGLIIQADGVTLTDSSLDILERSLAQHAGGSCRVYLQLRLPEAHALVALEKYPVHPREALLDEVRALLGPKGARFSANMPEMSC